MPRTLPVLHFHPYVGWYVPNRGVKMTQEEKEDRLCGYPYYAEAAVEFLVLRARSSHLPPVDPDGEEQAAIDRQCHATVEAMAKAMTEGQLAFVRALVLFAERQAERQAAGLLAGMTPKARAKWIEEHK